MAYLGISGFSDSIRQLQPPQVSGVLQIDQVEGVSFRGDARNWSEVAAFESGSDFGTFKLQVEKAFDTMRSFADNHLERAEARHVQDAFELVETRLFDLAANYYADMRGAIYGAGKRSLDLFVMLLQHTEVPIEAKRSCLIELGREISNCPPAFATHLAVAGRELQLRAGGMWAAVWMEKERIAWDVVGKFVTRHHATPEGGGDVHYRNTYFADLSPSLGLPLSEDMVQERYPVPQELLTQALQEVQRALSPARVAHAMAVDCLARVQEALARDFPAALVPQDQVHALDGLWVSLAPRFGRFPSTRVLTEAAPNDPASPMCARTCPDLLALAFLDSFGTMGLLEPSQKPVAVASWQVRQDQRSIKVELFQWADEPLLWIKQQGAVLEFQFDHLLAFGAVHVPPHQRGAAIEAAIARCPVGRLQEVPLAWLNGAQALVSLFTRFDDARQAESFIERHRTQLMMRDSETRATVARAACEQCTATLVPLLRLWNLLEGGEGLSMLRSAVERGHVALVQTLLGAGVSPIEQGSPLLHVAIEAGHSNVVCALLEAGVDPNGKAADAHGATPLITAAQCHSVAALKVLVNWPGVHIEATNNLEETALLACVRDGEHNLPVLKVLLPVADVEACHGTTGTVLHAVAMADDVESLNHLLDTCGADVDAQDRNGLSALMKAAQLGQLGAVQSLIDHHASLSQKDRNGLRAVHHAVKGGVETVELFLPYADRIGLRDSLVPELLMRAVHVGERKVVDLVLQTWPGLNAAELTRTLRLDPGLVAVATDAAECLQALLNGGWTIGRHAHYGPYLPLAAKTGHPAVLMVLAHHDRDSVNEVDHFKSAHGRTALHCTVQALIEHKVLPQPPDPQAFKDGFKYEVVDFSSVPLDVGALLKASLARGQLDQRFGLVLQCLTKLDASWSIPDAYGHTPLAAALAPEHAALLARLVEHLDPNRPDHLKAVVSTALTAVTGGRVEALKALLQWDARVADGKNPLGRTLLTLAAVSGELDCLRAIVAHRPDQLTAHDGTGATALIAAVQGNKLASVQTLIELGLTNDQPGADGRNAMAWADLLKRDNLKPHLDSLLKPGVKRQLEQ